MIELNEQDFNKYLQEKEIVLVYFTAQWCSFCKFVGPVMEELSSTYNVVKVDCDEQISLTNNHNVKNLPTVLLFKNNVEVKRFVGVVKKESILAELK